MLKGNYSTLPTLHYQFEQGLREIIQPMQPPVTHQIVPGWLDQVSQRSLSIQMLFSGQFWKQAIYSLYYFVSLHLHGPAGFVINVKT